MKRFILDDLRKWKETKRRKPLIVKGARQVGKTWVLEEFGKEFKDGYLHINFDKLSRDCLSARLDKDF